MAIRFSMSEDTSIVSSTTAESKRRNSSEQEFVLTEQVQNNVEEAAESKTQTTCRCSNIRVMQLFYEMKQEFPNIPDEVVNQHVIENIHDPENCKTRLKREIESYLAPVQSYPQKLLRVLNRDSVLKKQVHLKSSVQTIDTKNINRSNFINHHSPKNNCDFNDAAGSSKHNPFNPTKCKQVPNSDIKDMRSGVCSIQITTYSTDQNNSLDVFEKEKSQLPLVPQRPTTLRLKKALDVKDQLSQANKRDLSTQPKSKNKPSGDCGFPSNSPSSNPTSPKFGKKINTVTTIQSPTTFTDLGKSEILVNVSLSPSSHGNQVGGTQRHQSTINVRPELPFTRNLESAAGSSSSGNHKSYTSVNLVLRQPSASPQSPINITVGPNLTYSSSSYHARLGCQNNYHITVTDEGGVFSAFRISPLNYNNSRTETINNDVCDETPNNLDVDFGSSTSFHNSIVKPTNSCGQSDARKIVMRQHKQKERLLAVLRKNKNKLSLVHKEVDLAIQTDINDGVSESLDEEIDKLRCDCQTMLNEIENSRICGLSEDSIEQTNSIKNRQAHSFPKIKPLRYAAPPISTNCFRNHQRSFPNEAVSQRRQPSIAYRDENSDFGAGD